MWQYHEVINWYTGKIVNVLYTHVFFRLSLCRPVGWVIMRQILTLLHLFTFFAVRQVCGPVVPLTLVLTLCVVELEVIKVSFYELGISGTDCGNYWWPPSWDSLSSGGCLRYQRVHESTLLTRTCSVCSGIQYHGDKAMNNIKCVRYFFMNE